MVPSATRKILCIIKNINIHQSSFRIQLLKKTVKLQKRKINMKTVLPKTKMRRLDPPLDQRGPSPIPSLSSDDENDPRNLGKNLSSLSEDDESKDKKTFTGIYESPEKTTSALIKSSPDDDETEKSAESPSSSKRDIEKITKSPDSEEIKKYKNSIPEDQKLLIKKLFLLAMPDDFYQFYEFCRSLAPDSPGLALRAIGLELVGPFDVLFGKVVAFPEGAEEKYLRHWRYFYDPPEFQTILKGNDKEGLHFGYWRDEDCNIPVFVARNSAMVECKIIPVAETIFGAVLAFIEENLKKASPFEKSCFSLLFRKVKQFAKGNNISLELMSVNMKSRDRKSVAKTFHGAGIVVPYDKKTQVGYRILAVTDTQLKKVLEKVHKGDEDTKKEQMSKIDEIIRLATIAADECDFGTPLELAHDLFSSGIPAVEKRALQMFTMSYSLLQRPLFCKIAVAHLKDRKKNCNLNVF
uniref:CD027 protein n=1 Tax=Fopius arisanus TaxID=64838 RepID=A0A0C9R7D1_9HYME